MNFDEFHNALRILLSIDADEFTQAIDPALDGAPSSVPAKLWDEWTLFCRNPHMWFIRAPDEHAKAIWEIVVSRQPKGESPK